MTTLSLFAAAALGLLLVPGPAVLYITARSAAQGPRAGLVSVLGIHTGTLVHIAAAVAGLSALVAASAAAFSTVKLAGAAYLVFLGVRAVRAHDAAAVDTARSGSTRSIRPLRRVYADGVVVNVLNPKTALFFLAFLPQFADPRRGPLWLNTLILGLVFMALGLASDSAYSLAGAGVGRWMRRRPRARRRGRFVEGGVLIGLGVVALLTPSHRRAV